MSEGTRNEGLPEGGGPTTEERLASLERRHAELFRNFRDFQVAVSRQVRKLVEAGNASAVVLGAVEDFLNETHPDWDAGKIEEMNRRAEGLKKRDRLLAEASRLAGEKNVDREALEKLAREVWANAKEVSTTLEDGVAAVGLLLKAGKPIPALDVLREFEGLHGEKLPEAIQRYAGELRRRAEDLRGVAGN